jgi:hypothetical protein
MSSIYDMDDVLSAEEIEAVKQNARQRLSLWRRRGVYSTSALLLSCLLVYLFLEGSPLHANWESFGKYLVLVSMALQLVFLYCKGLWWSASRALRDLEKG